MESTIHPEDVAMAVEDQGVGVDEGDYPAMQPSAPSTSVRFEPVKASDMNVRVLRSSRCVRERTERQRLTEL
jgi:hypothetical protein